MEFVNIDNLLTSVICSPVFYCADVCFCLHLFFLLGFRHELPEVACSGMPTLLVFAVVVVGDVTRP